MDCTDCFAVVRHCNGSEVLLRKGLSQTEADGMATAFNQLSPRYPFCRAEVQPTALAIEQANSRSRAV